ncbi:MAG: DUF1385 domain-containing protein [Chthonomonas sp.]|nr:DUF1385 domain-containing protein [Chthonomonas sp.]
MPKGEYLQYGGQAIIEGVMMRTPRFFSIACRAPNGTIVRITEPLEKTWIGRQKWLMKPFLRGTFALLDGMTLGLRAMRFASDVQMDTKYSTEEQIKAQGKPVNEKVQNAAVLGAIIFSLAVGILIFNVMPNALAEMLRTRGVTNGTIINYTSEVIKLVVFIGYLWMISKLPDVREVFRYHGAEHKAINALEHDQPLDIATCQAQTRLHPRCGTSFAVIVFIIGFLFLPLVPRYPITGQQGNPFQDVPVRILMELMLLPIIAGLSYEALRLAGRLRDEKWVNVAFKPGLWTQLITTQEPAEKHVEVALAALQAVVDAEDKGEVAVTGIEVLESKYTETSSEVPA